MAVSERHGAPAFCDAYQTMCQTPQCMTPAAEKADSTLMFSQAVPHPSTNEALCRLTSEVRRDPVYSTRYGRQRKLRDGILQQERQRCAHTRRGCSMEANGSRKADSTWRCSQAVPHPSTNQALGSLTSEVRRDPVYSTRYGRQQGV